MTGKMQAPDGWQVVRLGDVCAPPEYGAAAASIPYAASLPRYVRITDITDDGRLRVEDKRSADPRQVEGYHLEDGDLLFARSGSVGRTYLYQSQDGPCVFAGYLIRFCPLPDQAIPEYLEHWTHSDSYYRWIASVARRGAQTNINAAEYSSLPILLPPLPEQRAIAAVLDSIDEAIEGVEAVITATERLRNALLHELLTRGVPGWHTQWKDVPGIGTIPAAWDVVRLGEVLESTTYGTNEPLSTRGEMVVLRMNNLQNGEINLSEVRRADLSKKEVHELNLVPGDILFNRTNSLDLVGKVGVVRDLPELISFASYLIRLRTVASHANSFWLSALLWSANCQSRIRKFATPGVSQANINPTSLGSLTIPLPPLPEQEATAKLLDGVDVTLAAARREGEGLQLLKESTADALLTGRVRVEVGERIHDQ